MTYAIHSQGLLIERNNYRWPSHHPFPFRWMTLKKFFPPYTFALSFSTYTHKTCIRATYVYITYVRWKILILKSVVNFVSSNFIYSKNTSIKILFDLFIHLIKKKKRKNHHKTRRISKLVLIIISNIRELTRMIT